ncbi:hypothetical protein BELL_0421g00070 [Botrytis elliptica]|uniref:Uncharacterized protein n=1 Tax=Botrytis elliptica TaxID=278938 RepID=A0A4Z1JGC3_9HELO|nr:hypothetical protein BELL_0421g00070 [Botrytis elliptica]
MRPDIRIVYPGKEYRERDVVSSEFQPEISIDSIDVNEGFAVPSSAPRIKLKNLPGWRSTKPFTNSGSKLKQS